MLHVTVTACCLLEDQSQENHTNFLRGSMSALSFPKLLGDANAKDKSIQAIYYFIVTRRSPPCVCVCDLYCCVLRCALRCCCADVCVLLPLLLLLPGRIVRFRGAMSCPGEIARFSCCRRQAPHNHPCPLPLLRSTSPFSETTHLGASVHQS